MSIIATARQDIARADARAALDAENILTVWRIDYRIKLGRRLEPRQEHVLAFCVAERKRTLYTALGYKDVTTTPVHVFTHDYP